MKAQIRVTAFILLAVMLLASLCVTAGAEATVTKTKAQRTSDIVIAYDDSGSMAGTPIQDAKYAAEIFAAMLDYKSGDKLTIYRMSDNYDKIELTDLPANYGHDVLAPLGNAPGGTYFYPVYRGFSQLNSSSHSKKWIIFMTDGSGINFSNCGSMTSVPGAAQTIVDNGISFQYLGFGGAEKYDLSGVKLKTDTKAGSEYVDSTDKLLETLVKVCNTIFDRNEIKLDKDKLSFGISMEKVIVFAQGDNVKINALRHGNDSVNVISDSKKITHANGSTSGQVVIFGACKAGEYTLDCTGATSVQVFYELDVDMNVSLSAVGNKKSVKIDNNTKALPAGEYKVDVELIDNGTGKKIDISKHSDLLGKTEIATWVKKSGDSKAKPYSDNVITLTEDDSTEIEVRCSYLDGKYTISSKDTKTSLPISLDVINLDGKNKDLGLAILQEQPDGRYDISLQDSWKPLAAEITFKGKPLTETEMKYVTLTFDEDNPIGAEIIKTEDNKIYFKLVPSSDGAPSGKVDFKVSATFGIPEFAELERDATEELLFGRGLNVEADVLQTGSWYTISEKDKWEPIKVDVTLDGNPLTPEQLEALELDIVLDGVSWRLEQTGESSFYIYIGQAEDGGFVTPEKGKYEFDVTAKLSKFEDSDSGSFSVRLVPLFVVYLFWIIVALILFIIWLLIMLTKVLPKKIDKDDGSSQVVTMAGSFGANFVNMEYRRRQKTLRVYTKSLTGAQLAATFKLKPVDNRFTKSKQREFGIVGISSSCDSITLNGFTFVKAVNGTWVAQTALDTLPEGAKLPPINFRGRNTLISLYRNGDSLDTRTVNVK